MNMFENKDGQLSRYALSCGYIQEKKTDTLHVTLFKRDGTYVVRAWDINNPYDKVADEWLRTITDARKLFKSLGA